MNAVSRRAVMGAGALAVAAEPFVSVGTAVAAGPGLYSRTRFAAAQGKAFRLGGRTVRLSTVVGTDSSFSVRFKASARMLQGTYVLRRAGFQDTSLLVVPITRDGRTLEAIVNP